MSNNRNRPRLEGRCSPEVPALVDKLQELIPGSNKSDVLETAVRLLAEIHGVQVPMNKLSNIHTLNNLEKHHAQKRSLEHFDRSRSEYERARFEASSAGGVAKRENLVTRQGVGQSKVYRLAMK